MHAWYFAQQDATAFPDCSVDTVCSGKDHRLQEDNVTDWALSSLFEFVDLNTSSET